MTTTPRPNATPRPRRTRAVLVRTRASARTVRGWFPLTTLGVVVSGVAGTALAVYAYDERDLVAFMLAGGVLALVLLTTLFTASATAWVATRHRNGDRGGPLVAITSDETATGFELPSLAIVPLLSIDSRVVVPSGIDSRFESDFGRMRESVRFDSRGRHADLVRAISIGDVFGLSRIDFLRTEVRDAIVTPHFGRLDRLPTLRSFAHGDDVPHPSGSPDGDRLDVRRYAPGDPARYIHWKAFARTGKVVVRVPERAVATSERVVAYQVSGTADDPSAAAALAALSFGALGSEWTFGADGNPAPIRDVDSARLAVAASAAFRADGARDLDAFLRTILRDGPISLILFVPPTEGPWLDRVLALPRDGLPLRFVIGVDEVVEDRVRTRVERAIRYDVPLVGTSRAELDRVRMRLSNLGGADVVVVERPTGRVLSRGRASSAALPGAAA